VTLDEIPDTGETSPEPDPGPSRQYRASAVFLTGGLLTIVIALVLSQSLLQIAPPIRGAVALLGTLPGAIAMVVAAFGIAWGRPWAIAIATPMLVVILVAAVVDFAIAFSHSTINLPITALLAVWALRAPLRVSAGATTVSRSGGFTGALVFVALLLSTGWPVLSPLLLQNGGPFIVAEDALQPSLLLTCHGAPDVAPASVTVEYDWRWSKAEPWAAGNDTITLEAYTTIDEDASGYAIDVSGTMTAGITEADILIFEPKGAVFGIDLGQAGYAPGSVGISLQQAGEPTSPHGSIQVQATYLHAPANTGDKNSSSAWSVQTEAQCEW
jgi:hypothetical protein